MRNQANRRTGDPIPPHLVREFRDRHGLTQEELAERLGVRGGKAVISGWENGRAACEGPAAEFLLYLLGRGSASVGISTLNADVDRVWGRAGDKVTTWRQVLFVPDAQVSIEATKFVDLFPKASLEDGMYGFPFRAGTILGNVAVGLQDRDWLGSIPADGQPSFVWMFKRDGRFAYRERLWEDSERSACRGQIDVQTQLWLALRATHLLGKLAPLLTLSPELTFHFRMDLEGVRGRALVDCSNRHGEFANENRWSSEHAHAELSATVTDVVTSPPDLGVRLVSEMASQISATFTDPSTLRRLIRTEFKRAPLKFIDPKSI